jgi:hypothetical protein
MSARIAKPNNVLSNIQFCCVATTRFPWRSKSPNALTSKRAQHDTRFPSLILHDFDSLHGSETAERLLGTRKSPCRDNLRIVWMIEKENEETFMKNVDGI